MRVRRQGQGNRGAQAPPGPPLKIATGGDGIYDNGNGSNDYGNSSDINGDDSSSSMIPTFSENVGVVPDMSGKEPVDYLQLFTSDHIIESVLEETNRYGDQYVEYCTVVYFYNHSRKKLGSHRLKALVCPTAHLCI